MADGILTLCNVALISPRDCTLQCGMWLWNRDSEFTKWQHPAMWYVALGWHAIESARWQHPAMWHVALELWHWILQVAAHCSVAGGSGMTCHWIRPNVRHIGILHLDSISTTSRQSTCHSASVSEILSKSDHPRQKKMTSCRFSRWRISAILKFRGPMMDSLKSQYTTSYRSSIETIALNCLVFEKIALFAFWRQTDIRTDEQKPVAWSRSTRCRERRIKKWNDPLWWNVRLDFWFVFDDVIPFRILIVALT